MKGPYDQSIFQISESLKEDSFIKARYLIQTPSSDPLGKAGAIALEQSTGTWTDVPEETRELRERHAGKVTSINEIPLREMGVSETGGERIFFIDIAYPVENIKDNLQALLTTLLGNISMSGKLKLVDVEIPKSFAKHFKGPGFGIEGLRRFLKVDIRPLLVGMFKPCIGMDPQGYGRMFEDMASEGIDVVKDDELICDPHFCSVERRLEECLKVQPKAEKRSGRKTLYAINVTDRPDKMMEKAKKVVSMGGNCLMINTFATGYGSLEMLAEEFGGRIPVMAHPAMAGAYFSSPDYGFGSNLILGKFARLAGCDMIIYPSPYGKVPMVRERSIRVAQELTAPFYHLKRVFPGPAAGMHPGMVPSIMADFGADVLIGAGGGIHGHPEGTGAGVKAFFQAISSAMNGISLKEASQSKINKELKVALNKWAVQDGSSTPREGKFYDLLR